MSGNTFLADFNFSFLFDLVSDSCQFSCGSRVDLTLLVVADTGTITLEQTGELEGPVNAAMPAEIFAGIQFVSPSPRVPFVYEGKS